MALLHNRTREKIHAVKDRVSGLEMGQQNLEELMRQQKTMIKQLNESLVALEMTVVETKEALSCAQTWVVLVLLILAETTPTASGNFELTYCEDGCEEGRRIGGFELMFL